MPLPSPFHRLQSVAARPLVRNVLKVSTGNLVGNAFNFVALALLSATLDPGPRGLFTSMQAAMMLMATLADFGINTTIIKYYRDPEASGGRGNAEALMRRALWLRLTVAGVMAAVAALFARPLCAFWLDDPDVASLFRLICLGALGSAIWMYCQAAMQARQQFGWYALLTIANHALRLALFGALVAMQRMAVAPAVVVLMAVPFAGSIGAALLWPREFWRAHMSPRRMAVQTRRILAFSRWIFLSNIIVAVIMRLDVLLLSYLTEDTEVGQFGNAYDLAQGFPLLTMALSTVLLPRLAATRNRAEMQRIVRIFLHAVPLMVAAVAVVIVAAHLLVPYLRGGLYVPSIPVFDLLVIGYTISIFVTPLSFFCLAFERAHWLTWMNLAQLGINLLVSLLLIPPFGAIGAGISAVAVRLFALLFLAMAYRRLLALAEDESLDTAGTFHP